MTGILICLTFCTHTSTRIITEEISSAAQKNITRAKNLTHKAITYLQKTNIFEACSSLANNPEWQSENIKLILFDRDGVIWLLQGENFRLWDDRFLKNVKTVNNTGLLDELRGKRSGFWLDLFSWQDDLISGYFKNFTKNGSEYTLGALLFVENAVDQVQEKVIKTRQYVEKFGIDNTVLAINNPRGIFLTGSLSITIYDDKGICLANSFDQTYIGNRGDLWRDDAGVSVFEEFRAVTQEKKYGWIENTFAKETQRTFVLKIKDPVSSKYYYLVSGYYPDIDDNFVTAMARNACDYLTKEGSEKAFNALNKRLPPFYKSRLATVIYNDKGIIMTHSRFPYLQGTDALNEKDQGGYLITQEILNRLAKEKTAWIYSYTMNAIQPIYGEKVTLPEGTFAVTIQGYTPASMRHLCAQRAEFIRRKMALDPLPTIIGMLNFKTDRAIQQTYDIQSWFHGRTFIEMYDQNNFCVAAGPYYHKLWNRLDEHIIKRVAQLHSEGLESAWFDYRENSKTRSVYLRLCPHDYLLVSGYETLSEQS